MFFVVSGFVITSMLLREWLSTQRIASRPVLSPARTTAVGPPGHSDHRHPRAGSDGVLANRAALDGEGPGDPRRDHDHGQLLLPAGSRRLLSAHRAGYPLLHTWSLSVEEQFHVAFPIVFLGLLGLPRGRGGVHRATVIRGLAFLASLGASIALSYGHVPTVWPRLAMHVRALDPLHVAFFLPLTRTWEFRAGALLALAATRWTPGPLMRGASATTRLALLVMTVVTMRSTDVLPGGDDACHRHRRACSSADSNRRRRSSRGCCRSSRWCGSAIIV